MAGMYYNGVEPMTLCMEVRYLFTKIYRQVLVCAFARKVVFRVLLYHIKIHLQVYFFLLMPFSSLSLPSINS